MLPGGPLEWPGHPLIAESHHMPATRLLVPHPIPVIAVSDEGAVLFANNAFAEVLGCSRDAVTSISYDDICSALPADETFFAATELRPDTVGSLLGLGWATLFVKMHRSAILSGADSAAVALYDGLMKRLSHLAGPLDMPLDVRSTAARRTTP